MKKIVLFSAIALLLFALSSCEKKEIEEEVILPNAKITKTLPIMYQSAKSEIKIENGKIVIINSKKELNDLFKNSNLPKYLANVDFNKNSVIVGTYLSNYGVDKLEHKFVKIEDKYEYTLTVIQNFACVMERVGFGIVVEKIPSNSEVIFKVNVKH